MLGQIERGESSPTLATLWKIISGFEVSFSTFLDPLPTIGQDKIHPGNDFKQMHPQDDKILIKPLFAYDKSLHFEMFLVELLPGCEHLSLPHPQGIIEHIVVVNGEMEVLANSDWQHLKQKDGIRFNADKPHGYRNTSGASSVFHNIIHYPK